MYPIAYEADYERNPSRVTTFFRLIPGDPVADRRLHLHDRRSLHLPDRG